MDRIIALVDMDCFYVQVEQRLDPSLQGLPCAVVQYNEWQGGAIIAVNYEARDFGVKRHMRGNEAQSLCPDIKLVKVPEIREKADLTRYREAGAEVIDVLKQFSDAVERASIDEAYIDLTETVHKYLQEKPEKEIMLEDLKNSFVCGWDSNNASDLDKDAKQKDSLQSWLNDIHEQQDDYKDNIRLAIGAKIVEEMRAAVYQKTEFRCSAGIAHNKMIAKLCCGLNKPNKQTVVPQSSISHLYTTMPITNVRGFGGKFGEEVMEKLDVKYMADLSTFGEVQLRSLFGEKSGKWLYNVAHGLEYEAVAPRLLPKSVGCSKNFLGPKTLKTKGSVKHWLLMLSQELEERLIKDRDANKRFAKNMTVGITTLNDSGRRVAITRSCPVTAYCATRLHKVAYDALLKANCAARNSDAWMPPVISVCMSAGKFEDDICTSLSITKFFAKTSKNSKDSGPSKTSQTHQAVASSSFFNLYVKNKVDNVFVENSDLTEDLNPEKAANSTAMYQSNNCNETESTSNPHKKISLPDLSTRSKRRTKSIGKKAPQNTNSIINMLNRACNTEKTVPSEWHQLDIGEIDEDVLDNLPPDIKLEISKYKENVRLKRDQEMAENGVTDVKICPQCNEEIKCTKFGEHSDYHTAEKLSEDLNSVKPTVQVNHAVKRMKSPTKIKLKCRKKENRISSYFKEQ